MSCVATPTQLNVKKFKLIKHFHTGFAAVLNFTLPSFYHIPIIFWLQENPPAGNRKRHAARGVTCPSGVGWVGDGWSTLSWPGQGCSEYHRPGQGTNPSSPPPPQEGTWEQLRVIQPHPPPLGEQTGNWKYYIPAILCMQAVQTKDEEAKWSKHNTEG